MASAVTSRGCARVFVLSVLYRCLECAQDMFERGDSVQFPFKETKVASWLQQAAKDCTDNKEFNDLFGGTVYDPDDEASFWRQPHQFCTWWKNNIERKSKFQNLQIDAANLHNANAQVRDEPRAKYCQNLIIFSLNIKRVFDRYTILSGASAGNLKSNKVEIVTLLPIPISMPQGRLKTTLFSSTFARMEKKECDLFTASASSASTSSKLINDDSFLAANKKSDDMIIEDKLATKNSSPDEGDSLNESTLSSSSPSSSVTAFTASAWKYLPSDFAYANVLESNLPTFPEFDMYLEILASNIDNKLPVTFMFFNKEREDSSGNNDILIMAGTDKKSSSSNYFSVDLGSSKRIRKCARHCTCCSFPQDGDGDLTPLAPTSSNKKKSKINEVSFEGVTYTTLENDTAADSIRDNSISTRNGLQRSGKFDHSYEAFEIVDVNGFLYSPSSQHDSSNSSDAAVVKSSSISWLSMDGTAFYQGWKLHATCKSDISLNDEIQDIGNQQQQLDLDLDIDNSLEDINEEQLLMTDSSINKAELRELIIQNDNQWQQGIKCESFGDDLTDFYLLTSRTASPFSNTLTAALQQNFFKSPKTGRAIPGQDFLQSMQHPKLQEMTPNTRKEIISTFGSSSGSGLKVGGIALMHSNSRDSCTPSTPSYASWYDFGVTSPYVVDCTPTRDNVMSSFSALINSIPIECGSGSMLVDDTLTGNSYENPPIISEKSVVSNLIDELSIFAAFNTSPRHLFEN